MSIAATMLGQTGPAVVGLGDDLAPHAEHDLRLLRAGERSAGGVLLEDDSQSTERSTGSPRSPCRWCCSPPVPMRAGTCSPRPLPAAPRSSGSGVAVRHRHLDARARGRPLRRPRRDGRGGGRVHGGQRRAARHLLRPAPARLPATATSRWSIRSPAGPARCSPRSPRSCFLDERPSALALAGGRDHRPRRPVADPRRTGAPHEREAIAFALLDRRLDRRLHALGQARGRHARPVAGGLPLRHPGRERPGAQPVRAEPPRVARRRVARQLAPPGARRRRCSHRSLTCSSCSPSPSAPVSYVAPAREVSILIAAALGATVLSEGDVQGRLGRGGGDRRRDRRARVG